MLGQDFEDETGGYNGKVLKGRDHGRWGQGSGCTEKYRVDKYKPDMLTSWAVTQRLEM